ncbi:MAG: hypothetical protein EP343_19895 [Deltaproteobacteria bacterium]|nr:MAG: hypothetical protein EP343_19895 [Deltaproteobacteria bacterium]
MKKRWKALCLFLFIGLMPIWTGCGTPDGAVTVTLKADSYLLGDKVRLLFVAAGCTGAVATALFHEYPFVCQDTQVRMNGETTYRFEPGTSAHAVYVVCHDGKRAKRIDATNGHTINIKVSASSSHSISHSHDKRLRVVTNDCWNFR